VQRWEYQMWSVADPGSFYASGGIVVTVDGELLEPRGNLSVMLKQVGTDGWELVSMATDAGNWVYTFKRPKE
jgi:hypothetical protein